MAASSVTGTGHGAVETPNTKEISAAPGIIFAGVIEASQSISSPPSTGNQVVFPYVLPGSSDGYVAIITSLNAGLVYVTSMNEDDNGDFIGFDFNAEAEGSVMYIVTRVGSKPEVV